MRSDPKATPAQQQAWADRYEREMLGPLELSINWLRVLKSETCLVVGCGPSLNTVNPSSWDWKRSGIVSVNNSHEWCKSHFTHPRVNVFLDMDRFVDMAPDVDDMTHVAAMFTPAKPISLLEQWWNTAKHELKEDQFIPIRSTGQNGRMSNIDNGGDVSKGIPVMAGSVIFPAIQIAALMAQKNIVLLGCDFDWSGPRRHWDGVERSHKDGADTLWERTGRAAMVKLRDRLAERGVTLWKGTPGGKIDCLEEWGS